MILGLERACKSDLQSVMMEAENQSSFCLSQKMGSLLGLKRTAKGLSRRVSEVDQCISPEDDHSGSSILRTIEGGSISEDCRLVGLSAAIVISAQTSCLAGNAEFGMGLKWIGGRGASSHGILEICTCSASAGMRLKKGKIGVVVFL